MLNAELNAAIYVVECVFADHN